MIDECLRGERLYGDDFSAEETDAWYRDEAEAYFHLYETPQQPHDYAYHALNWEHGFRFLPPGRFAAVLGVGSAFGQELGRIANRCDHITILESAPGFVVEEIGGTPVQYVAPQSSGGLPFPSQSFDLVTCLGVLHHIPNVTRVVTEIYRCTRPGGYALIREPIVSMGDWRRPRPGLTARERGLPLRILRRLLLSSGFEVIQERLCMFSLMSRLGRLIGRPLYNSRPAVRIDGRVCRLGVWPTSYHATRPWERLRPTAAFFVVRRSV